MNFFNRVGYKRRPIARAAACLLLLAWFFFQTPGGFLAAKPAYGQNTGRVSITAPDVSQFPKITDYLTIYDGQGQFFHGLQAGEMTALEDGNPVKVDQLQEVETGVSTIVAINAGLILALRDPQGISRYDTISAALKAWITAQDATSGDDYSLLTNPGPLASYVTDPADWLTAFENYQPDMRNTQPSLNSLNQALTMAGDPPSGAGRQRAILYITPTPDDSLLTTLATLTGEASKTGVPIFIWMVGAESDFSSPGAAALAKLANDTGGSLFAFSGAETLPDLKAMLEPFRYSYALSYTSALNSSGDHTLAIAIKRSDFEVTTGAQPFGLTLEPPNPMFVTPPGQIVLPSEEAGQTPAAVTSPAKQTLHIMVEFPDGHPRELVYSRLYVDGKMVSENAAAPFDSFTWDLSGYTSTGRHVLAVEVQDTLGLTTMSSGVTVEVIAPAAAVKPDTLDTIKQNSNLLPWIALATAGPALIVMIFVSWRRSQKKKARLKQGAGAETGPQAAETGLAAETLPVNAPVIEALARLVKLSEDTRKPLAGNPIPVGSGETWLGRDPLLGVFSIDEPSVEERHARLSQSVDGSFKIYDQGTTAGTWVNFAPTSQEGAPLEHGDLIHIGRAAFRFELEAPTHIRKIEIVLLPKN